MSRPAALAVLPLCGVLACGCASVGSRVPARPQQARAFAAELSRLQAAGSFDGAVWTTLSEDSVHALGRRRPARGSSPEVPMTADSLFDVASVTKPIVAACAALLAAEGKIDPSAPFTRYLPEHVLGADTLVTVRDLATHMSGFDYPDLHRREGDFLKSVLAFRPARPRGEFRYSCYNYILLGLVVERVSGSRLDVFAAERLFAPLGMKDSRWGPLKDGRTVFFPHARPGRSPVPPGTIVDQIATTVDRPVGNAGLFTTAADLKLFLADLLARRTFPKAYYDLQFTPVEDAKGNRRTFGWDMRASRLPAGVSALAIGHTGSTGQSLVLDPATGFGAVLLTARRAGHDEAIRSRLAALELLTK